MTKRIKLKPSRAQGIPLAPPKVRSVQPEAALREIGAEPVALSRSGGSPLAVDTLRRGLLAALKSTGGRPALEGASRRQKIPMSDADWHTLEQIAESMKMQGSTVSAGQVAAQLLSGAISACRASSTPYAMVAHEPPPLRASDVSRGVSHQSAQALRRCALRRAQEAGERRVA
jgi:hypothetical protein